MKTVHDSKDPDTILAFIDSKERQARARPNKLARIAAGWYFLYDGKDLWHIEHVGPWCDFLYSEWHYGSEDDPHADQAATLGDVVRSILG